MVIHRSMGLSRRALLRFSALGVASIAVAPLVSACSSSAPAAPTAAANASSSSAAPTNAPTPAAAANAAAPSSAEVRVSVWPDVADLDINNGIITAFGKQNTKIKVTPEQWVGNYYQKLQVGVAGGTVPDMVYFQGWMWQPYAMKGQIREIDSYIQKDKDALPEDLFPANLDAYVRQLALKGKHYGMPQDTGSMVIYYSKDLFDLAGVPYPKDGWTQQDFLDTCQKVQDGLKKAGKTDMFAYQPNYDIYTRAFRWWRADGGMEFDQLEDPKKAQWDQSEIAAAMQLELHDLADKGLAITKSGLLSATGGASINSYGIQNGLVALKYEGPWFLPQMWGDKAVTKGGTKFDVVQAPKGSAGFSTFWQVEPIVIWNTSKNPDACWEYLKFAVSTEGQQFVAQGGRMTNTPKSITDLWAPVAQKLYNFENASAFALAEGASILETGGVSSDQFQVKGGLNAARDAIINGTKTAKQALSEANPLCQKVLDDWWKENPSG